MSEHEIAMLEVEIEILKADHDNYVKLKSDVERWLQRLGIQPRQMEDAKAKIVDLKEALFRNAENSVEVRNYATGTILFFYVFREHEPQVKDVIVASGNEYTIIGRQWHEGRLCLLVSNAGVVKA